MFRVFKDGIAGGKEGVNQDGSFTGAAASDSIEDGGCDDEQQQGVQ